MCLLLYAQGYFSDVLTGREVSFMSMDMAEEIRALVAAKRARLPQPLGDALAAHVDAYEPPGASDADD